MDRLPKVQHIPLVENSTHEKFSDIAGAGVIVCCCNEAPFQFNSPQLLCVQRLARWIQKRKSEGDKKVIKPTLNPLKAFITEIEFCFISAKPREAPSASSESPSTGGYFLKVFLHWWKWYRGSWKTSGHLEEGCCLPMGVVFLWACRGGVGFRRQLAKTHPSLLVHVTTWYLCQRSWWYTFWLACCISVPTIYIYFILLAVRPGRRCTYINTSYMWHCVLCYVPRFPYLCY